MLPLCSTHSENVTLPFSATTLTNTTQIQTQTIQTQYKHKQTHSWTGEKKPYNKIPQNPIMRILLGGKTMNNFDFILLIAFLYFPILYNQYITLSENEITTGIMFLQIWLMTNASSSVNLSLITYPLNLPLCKLNFSTIYFLCHLYVTLTTSQWWGECTHFLYTSLIPKAI